MNISYEGFLIHIETQFDKTITIHKHHILNVEMHRHDPKTVIVKVITGAGKITNLFIYLNDAQEAIDVHDALAYEYDKNQNCDKFYLERDDIVKLVTTLYEAVVEIHLSDSHEGSTATNRLNECKEIIERIQGE